MSRSGYSEGEDYDDPWPHIRWRGAVASAMRGRRGQAFLRELRAALDALPNKRLVGESFQRTDGEVCALGAVARARGISTVHLEQDPEDLDDSYELDDRSPEAAETFAIPRALAAEIMYNNDREWGWPGPTPEKRWDAVSNWVDRHLLPYDPETGEVLRDR